MWFWPGLDQWPSPKEVWIVGQVILGVVVAVCIALSMRMRLRQMNTLAEEFRRPGSDD